MRRFVISFFFTLVTGLVAAQSWYTTSDTRLYDGPSENYPVHSNLKKGTKIKVEKYVDSNWAFVSGGNKIGYIQISKLTQKKPSSNSTNVGSAINSSDRNNVKKVLSGSEIFEKYDKAVFKILTTDGEAVYQGSGFFINNKGWAVSNYHVFEDCNAACVVLSNDDVCTIKRIIARSAEPDFIIFEVDYDNKSFIPLANKRPKVGEPVYAISSPKGLMNTMSSGEVSAWREDFQMQISVPIDHGSSGGALIDRYGCAVGITSGSLDASSGANLNFAWSTLPLKSYLE